MADVSNDIRVFRPRRRDRRPGAVAVVFPHRIEHVHDAACGQRPAGMPGIQAGLQRRCQAWRRSAGPRPSARTAPHKGGPALVRMRMLGQGARQASTSHSAKVIARRMHEAAVKARDDRIGSIFDPLEDLVRHRYPPRRVAVVRDPTTRGRTFPAIPRKLQQSSSAGCAIAAKVRRLVSQSDGQGGKNMPDTTTFFTFALVASAWC